MNDMLLYQTAPGMDLALQLDQPKAHSFQKSFRMRWLAPG